MLDLLNVRKILQVMVALLALMLLVFVSAFATLKIMTWGKTVKVPDIRGKELAAAVNILREDGLEVNVERQEYHSTVPQNAVIYQDPAPGATVKKGREVAVVVSLGSEEVRAPKVTGEAFRQAQILLQQAGLVLGEVGRVGSKQPRNTVITQYPAPGSVMQKGSRIDMLVGNGPRSVRFVTPELSGRTMGEAEQLTRVMAIKLVAGGKGGVIVSQNPAAGMQITAGSPLYVTLGSR